MLGTSPRGTGPHQPGGAPSLLRQPQPQAGPFIHAPADPTGPPAPSLQQTTPPLSERTLNRAGRAGTLAGLLSTLFQLRAGVWQGAWHPCRLDRCLAIQSRAMISTTWYPGRYLGVGAPCVDVASFNVYLEDAATFKKYVDRLQVCWGQGATDKPRGAGA